MREIVSSKLYDTDLMDWRNEITDFLNLYLKIPYKKLLKERYCRGTYMMFRRKDGASIRFPGATRGHVEWDKNFIITKIVIYDYADFDNKLDIIYRKEVRKLLDRFIGDKIIIPEGIDLEG